MHRANGLLTDLHYMTTHAARRTSHRNTPEVFEHRLFPRWTCAVDALYLDQVSSQQPWYLYDEGVKIGRYFRLTKPHSLKTAELGDRSRWLACIGIDLELAVGSLHYTVIEKHQFKWLLASAHLYGAGYAHRVRRPLIRFIRDSYNKTLDT